MWGLTQEETVSNLWQRLKNFLTNLVTKPSEDIDKNIVQAMHNSVESANQSLEATVAGFIARHPELSFERFGLPSQRLSPIVAFITADVIAMTLRRYHDRGEEPYFFRMFSDGSCEPMSTANIIPASSIINEIGRCMWESPWEVYRPTKPNLKPEENWNEFLAFRSDENGRDVIVPHLISWLFAALKVSPRLMYGYHAYRSQDPNSWILQPFGEDEPFNNCDKDDPWML